LEDLDKADVLEPNNVFTLRSRGKVKYMLDDNQRALEDFDKANVLEPNNAITLMSCGIVKYTLDDYQEALETIDKVHHLEPNNHLILQIQKWLKWMLNVSQPHCEGSVRLPLTLSKMGLGSPSRLPKIQSVIVGVKTPRIETFFISLERS